MPYVPPPRDKMSYAAVRIEKGPFIRAFFTYSGVLLRAGRFRRRCFGWRVGGRFAGLGLLGRALLQLGFLFLLLCQLTLALCERVIGFGHVHLSFVRTMNPQ